MRSIRYKDIAADLRKRVADGQFDTSGLLPSEAELSRHYSASRVTVRRSLELLRSEGLLESRQGYGWLVAGEPVSQDLSRLETIERQLEGSGVTSERRIIDFRYGPPPESVVAVLGPGNVLTVRRLNMADNVPFALVTVWCPEELAAPLSKNALEQASFLEQLGVTIEDATQTIGAEIIDGDDAALLQVPEGSPVLVGERITRRVGGDPVLVSRHVFPAHRTRFTVRLTADSTTFDPSAVQLVEVPAADEIELPGARETR